jgi:hypothetical protein
MTIKDFYIFCCNQGSNDILVQGAGVSSVNGVYKFMGPSPEVPSYNYWANTMYPDIWIHRSSSLYAGTWVIDSPSFSFYETDIGLESPIGATFSALDFNYRPAPTVISY